MKCFVVKGSFPIEAERAAIVPGADNTYVNQGELMQNVKIAGCNNFEVGRNLGKYWGDFFGERGFRKNYECLYEEYKEWLLTDKLATDRLFLLNNVALNFPELMSEIIGMVAE